MTADALRSINKLLAPRSVAVVGASARPGPGLQVLQNLHSLSFSGTVIPVNPKYEQILGHRCFATLSEAARVVGQIDAVAILLGRDRVLPALEEAASLGIRAAWAFAGGFAEAGTQGRDLQRHIAELCEHHRIALCGPNCVGVVNPGSQTGLFSAPLPPAFPSGSVSVVSQSGSVCLTLINGARDIGLRTIVSSGNEAVLDSTDYIDYFLDDCETHVIASFIEELRDPDRFVEVAERARKVGKPLVVLKVGRSEVAQRATVAHTGALAGADEIYEAVFRKYGVIRVGDLDELTQTCAALSSLGKDLPVGKRIGMLTLSGGAISLAADVADDLNLHFPDWSDEAKTAFREVLPEYVNVSNPLDAWGSGRIEETYDTCLQIAAADCVDVILLALDAPLGMPDAQREQFMVVARAAASLRETTSLPIIAISHLAGGLDRQLREAFVRGGVPLLQGTRSGLRALQHVIALGCDRDSGRPTPRVRVDRSGLFSSLRPGVLDEVESKEILAAAGLACVREFRCSSFSDVRAASDELMYPLVLKGIAPGVAHKSDDGLVFLDVQDERSARRAYEALERRLHGMGVERPVVVVQQMVQEVRAELLLGVVRDTTFGPCLVLGLGGALVEILRERVFEVPPLQRHDAERMLQRLLGGRFLAHRRGLQNADVEELKDALLAMSDLALSIPSSVKAIEINPLLVLAKGRGVLAVDALVEVVEPQGEKTKETHR